MGPAVAARAAASQKKPLLPQHVHEAHRIAPSPIRFPSSGSTPGRPAPPRYHSTDLGADEYTNENGVSNNTGALRLKDGASLPGLPKISRECLVAEIQCYGKYILPCLLVFAVGGILLALFLSGTLSR